MPKQPTNPSTHESAEPAAAPIPAWARGLVRVLDDGVKVPGTNVGLGLDAIIGFFVPTLGDAATGVGSLALLVLAFQRRVPRVIMLRMVLNIALDTLVGSLPLLGDVFDLFWRSNRRNLELLKRVQHAPARPAELTDYLVVGLGVALALAAVVLPLLLGVWLIKLISSHI